MNDCNLTTLYLGIADEGCLSMLIDMTRSFVGMRANWTLVTDR